MFSQELLTNGELNHFSLKERMVEIGKRWHKLSQSQKDKYKKQVEEQQLEYKVELDAWVKVHIKCCFILVCSLDVQTCESDCIFFFLSLFFSVSLASGASRVQRVLFHSECLDSLLPFHLPDTTKPQRFSPQGAPFSPLSLLLQVQKGERNSTNNTHPPQEVKQT